MEDALITHSRIRAFAEEQVNLPSEYKNQYRKQVNNLREELSRHIADNPGFGLVKMLHAGSVAKGTALRTINDLDAAVYVEKDQTPGDERNVVRWMGERLREAYPQKDSNDFDTSSPHCVRVHFRGSGLDVDIVPVIYTGEKDDYGYLIDKHTGERLRTSIPLHLKFIRRRKEANPEHFAQVVRLVKWWANLRKSEDSTFKCKSFLLELLMAHLADSGLKLNDYPTTLKGFFNYIARTGLEERVAFDDYPANKFSNSADAAIKVFDPVNAENNVTKRYTVDDRSKLVKAAEDAADAIREASYATSAGRAVESWRTVLGPSFRG